MRYIFEHEDAPILVYEDAAFARSPAGYYVYDTRYARVPGAELAVVWTATDAQRICDALNAAEGAR